MSEFEPAVILFQRAQMQLLLAMCNTGSKSLKERAQRIAKALDHQLKTFAPSLDV